MSDGSMSREAIIAPGIVFSDQNNVVPDVVWISKERLALLEDKAGHLTGSPELVVEVLSPGEENQHRDKEAKLKLYSIRGVQEYWIVDLFTKQVAIYGREEARLTLVATLLSNKEITSPLLPGFSCLVSRFFAQVAIAF
jgi:Uma2 family endonuclease